MRIITQRHSSSTISIRLDFFLNLEPETAEFLDIARMHSALGILKLFDFQAAPAPLDEHFLDDMPPSPDHYDHSVQPLQQSHDQSAYPVQPQQHLQQVQQHDAHWQESMLQAQQYLLPVRQLQQPQPHERLGISSEELDKFMRMRGNYMRVRRLREAQQRLVFGECFPYISNIGRLTGGSERCFTVKIAWLGCTFHFTFHTHLRILTVHLTMNGISGTISHSVDRPLVKFTPATASKDRRAAAYAKQLMEQPQEADWTPMDNSGELLISRSIRQSTVTSWISVLFRTHRVCRGRTTASSCPATADGMGSGRASARASTAGGWADSGWATRGGRDGWWWDSKSNVTFSRDAQPIPISNYMILRLSFHWKLMNITPYICQRTVNNEINCLFFGIGL